MLPSKKPYAESCDENRQPILDVLRPLFAEAGKVLEIGSGTGQHAVFFSEQMPHLTWQTSDRLEHHPGIRAWLADSPAENLLEPIALDVALDVWPETTFDAVFSANTAHIMGRDEVTAMFRGAAAVLGPGGLFALYGPFNYAGRYTSESNARFDRWLKQRDPRSGIKDVDDLNSLADSFGLTLAEDFEMPVNNRILVWTKVGADLAGR
jgi:cyclopropane fatty-acyl-phospholipid synthase-like methyltransferase